MYPTLRFSPQSKLRTQALPISPPFLLLTPTLPYISATSTPPALTQDVVGTSSLNCIELYCRETSLLGTGSPASPSWGSHHSSSGTEMGIGEGTFVLCIAFPLRPLLKTISFSATLMPVIHWNLRGGGREERGRKEKKKEGKKRKEKRKEKKILTEA